MRSVWRIGPPQGIQNDPPRTPKGPPRDSQGDPWTHIAPSGDTPECAKTSLCIVFGELWPLLGSLSCAELPSAPQEQPIIQQNYARATKSTKRWNIGVRSIWGTRSRQGLPKEPPGTPKESSEETSRATRDPQGVSDDLQVAPWTPRGPTRKPSGLHKHPQVRPKEPPKTHSAENDAKR